MNNYEDPLKTSQLQKIINRLVVPKFNTMISEYGLGEGVSIKVTQYGRHYDYNSDRYVPSYNIKITTSNPLLLFKYFSDSYYALYNIIADVSEYVDPSRGFVFDFRVFYTEDGDESPIDSELMPLFSSFHKSDEDYWSLIERNLQRIKSRLA